MSGEALAADQALLGRARLLGGRVKRLSLRFVMHLLDFFGAFMWGAAIGAVLVLIFR